jgi:RNA polymerase sigma factor (sigma-70 family)
MLRLHKKQEPAKSPFGSSQAHADLFLDRYDQLLQWSLRLTNDEQQARDIVHDAFIQFTLKSPMLNEIGNLDGYLWTMLRNMHISQVRRRISSPIRQLSIFDYDSAELGITFSDPNDRLLIHEQLRIICQYACHRKETSKAGSVLILRFFLGYYHGEIARVMQCSRQAVDGRLYVARREVMLFLANPQQLPGGAETSSACGQKEQSPNAFLNDLRHMIFESRKGDCLGRMELRALYSGPTRTTLGLEPLAHVVSCASCLDQTNKILDLPLLATRQPSDTIHPDKSFRGGQSGGSTAVEK